MDQENLILDGFAQVLGNRIDDLGGLCTWFTGSTGQVCFVRARGEDPIRWGCSTAILTFASAGGIDGPSIQRWAAALEAGLPSMAIVTGLDDISSDFDESAAIIRRISENHAPTEPIVAPLLADDESVAGFLDLLGMRIWLQENGVEVERACDPEHLSVTSDARERLIESILLATTDDAAVERAIDESLDPVSISALLVDSARAGDIVPVLGWGGTTGLSIACAALEELLPGLVDDILPAVMSCDGSPSEPLSLSGQSFATQVSSHALRVWSGSFPDGSDVTFGCTESGHLATRTGFPAYAGHIVALTQSLPASAERGVSPIEAPVQIMAIKDDQHA